MAKVSVLIVARDAEATLREAMQSALVEPVDEVLVVDDVSGDGTAEVARSLRDGRIRVVELDEHRTLGWARGRGLEEVTGDYCFLLDADDAFGAGRVARLKAALEEGYDFVADEVELEDGLTGRFMRRLEIPGFLDRPPGLARLFERNHLPGIGQIAFRTRSMRRLGYDPELHGVEDTDLVLRAVLAGYRGALIRRPGYCMRHFPNSVSRDREKQRAELARALGKHDPLRVRRLLRDRGMEDVAMRWAMASFLTFRGDYGLALEEIAELERICADRVAVVEPDGPWPFAEGWKMVFWAGTLELLRAGDPGRAARRLEEAVEIDARPEAMNNLGVALARLGKEAEARRAWRAACEALPGYADAAENVEARGGRRDRVTSHPMRVEASRREY